MIVHRLHAACPSCGLVVPLRDGCYPRHRLAGARGGDPGADACPATGVPATQAAVIAWLDATSREARATLAWIGRTRAEMGVSR